MLKKKDKSKEIQKKSFDLKYRPDTFQGYLGNERIKMSLSMRLKAGNIPHFIIFYGDSGCGKTSMGRLLSKEIMCEHPTPDGHSCGVCPTCKKITEEYIKLGQETCRGSIREPNLSKDTGKNYITDLIDQVSQKPLPPYTKRVVLLDEAHRTSPAAQNAMLKSLEEAPDFLYYILCTTEPEKLLDTVRGRATKYHVRKPTIKQMTDKLEFICRSEGLKYDIKALQMISRKNKCVPRNSIKALDDLKNFPVISQEVVAEQLDVMSNKVYVELFKNLDKDIVDVFHAVDMILENTEDIKSFADGLLRFVMDAINIRYGYKIEGYSDSSYKTIRKIFKKYSSDTMAFMLHNINKFSRQSFESDAKAEANLKELVILLSNPFFFDTKLKQSSRVLGAEKIEADTRYIENEKVRDEQNTAKDIIVDNASDIASIFGGTVVDTEGKSISGLLSNQEPNVSNEDTEQNNTAKKLSESELNSDITKGTLSPVDFNSELKSGSTEKQSKQANEEELSVDSGSADGLFDGNSVLDDLIQTMKNDNLDNPDTEQ